MQYTHCTSLDRNQTLLIAAHLRSDKGDCLYGWREHEAAVPLGYLLYELAVEQCNIHIALVELVMEFCGLHLIRGATKVVADAVIESTKPQSHWAAFHSNWSLNKAICTFP